MTASSSVLQVYSGYYYRRQIQAFGRENLSANTSSAAEESTRGDQVTLSQQGQDESTRTASSKRATESDPGKDADDQQEIDELEKLKRRDQEVRTHEQAHLSSAGRYSRGGMSFSYQRGPDGVAYAVSGEVGVDLGSEPTPEATLIKMQTIKRAAMAPANPSGADRQIAAQAAAKEAQARQEILRQTQEKLLQISADSSPGGASPQPPTDSGVQREPSAYASLKSAIAAYKNMAEA